jgi:hypothetical protein
LVKSGNPNVKAQMSNGIQMSKSKYQMAVKYEEGILA